MKFYKMCHRRIVEKDVDLRNYVWEYDKFCQCVDSHKITVKYMNAQGHLRIKIVKINL